MHQHENYDIRVVYEYFYTKILSFTEHTIRRRLV